MNGQTIKGIIGFVCVSVLGGAAYTVGSYLATKGIEEMHAAKERSARKPSKQNVKNRIIEFRKD